MASHSRKQELPSSLLLEIAAPTERTGHTDHASNSACLPQVHTWGGGSCLVSRAMTYPRFLHTGLRARMVGNVKMKMALPVTSPAGVSLALWGLSVSTMWMTA